MNQKLIAVAALAVVGAVYWKRTMTAAAAVGAGRPATTTQTPVNNTNSDMWTKLLGDGWKALLSSQTGQSMFGQNGYGDLVTSDGKPVSDTMKSILPNVLGDGYTPSLLGVEYYDNMFPLLSSEYWF